MSGPHQTVICAEAELNGVKLFVHQGSVLDMSSYSVECIVNAANERLEHNGGLAGAIADGAGVELISECRRFISRYGFLKKTQPVSTTAGNLPFKKVIHIAGPIVQYSLQNHQINELTNCVVNCIKEANTLELASIAIPGISCGIFGFPKKEAGVCHIEGFRIYATSRPLGKSIKEVHFVLFSNEELEHFLTHFFNSMEKGVYDRAKYIGLAKGEWNCQNYCCGGCSRTYERALFGIDICHRTYCNYCVYRYGLNNCLSCKKKWTLNPQSEFEFPDIFYNNSYVCCRICQKAVKINEGCCKNCKNMCGGHGEKVCTYCRHVVS